MRYFEFGKQNSEVIVLIHPSLVKWDYFERVIPLLEKEYHLIVPALSGYDMEDDSDFPGVEQIAEEINGFLKERSYKEAYAVYGCSMGGSIALLMGLHQTMAIRNVVMDGGITPYRLPWILTRFIALKDFLMMMIGKAGGIGLLEKVFATDEYSKEDLEYVAQVMKHCSSRTLWNTFDSCNNYHVPDPLPMMDTKISYWYADGEEKERKEDISYMKDVFPATEFTVLSGLGHAGLALLWPEEFAERMKKL